MCDKGQELTAHVERVLSKYDAAPEGEKDFWHELLAIRQDNLNWHLFHCERCQEQETMK